MNQITASQEKAEPSPRRLTRVGGANCQSTAGRTMVGQCSVPFKSALERDLLVILDFDPAVRRVRSQTLRVDWLDALGHRRRYTPNFLVEHHAAAPALIEVKSRADLWAEWPASKPRFRAARRYARDNKMLFSIFTEVEIRGPYFDNVVFLRSYQGRPAHEAHEETLMHALAMLGEATPQAVLLAGYASEFNRMHALTSLWRLVATHQVCADLSVPLTMQSAIWVPAGEVLE